MAKPTSPIQANGVSHSSDRAKDLISKTGSAVMDSLADSWALAVLRGDREAKIALRLDQ